MSKSRYYLLISGCLLLLILLFGIRKIVNEMMLTEARSKIVAISYSKKQRLDDILTNRIELSKLISSRTQMRISFKKYLETKSKIHIEKVQKILKDAEASSEMIAGITIHSMDGKLLGNSNTSFSDYLVGQEMVNKIKSEQSFYHFEMYHNRYYQFVMMPIALNAEQIGFVSVAFHSNTFTSLTSHDLKDLKATNVSIIEVETGRKLFASNESIVEEGEVTHEKYLTNEFLTNDKKIRILISIEKNKVLNEVEKIDILLLGCFILLSLSIFLVGLFYIHSETQRKKIFIQSAALEEAQEISKLGSWIFNLKDNKIEWSKYMFEIFPENIEDGEPSYENHKKTIHPDDVEKWEEIVNKCLSDSLPYVMKFRVRKNKEDDESIQYKWVEARGRGELNKNGEVFLIHGTCQDITEKIELEEQLRDEQLKLLQTSKLATLGEMAAGVAHEINNPLAIIHGKVRIIQRGKLVGEKLDSALEAIVNSITRISKIVSGLKKYSRSTDQKDRKTVSLKSVIAETMDIVNIDLKKTNVEILFDGISDQELYVDDIQIEQILINLIKNAIHEISHLNAPWIKVIYDNSPDHHRLTVQDCGRGLKSDVIGKVFNPFFTTKEVGKGTGLGLSISRSIAIDHGGDLFYELLDGHTSFVLLIPKEHATT